MTKEVATSGNSLPANIAEMLTGLKGQQEVSRKDASQGAFMKFKKGHYLYGVEEIEVEKGALWAVSPMSFVLGYHAWGDDGVLHGEETAGILDPPVVKTTLPEHTYVYTDKKTKVETVLVAKWEPFRGFQIVCVTEGEDEGVQCLLSGSSKGFKNAANDLMDAIVAQMETDPANPVAIIELSVDSYDHRDKTIGKVLIPEFEIDGWEDMEATEISEPEEEDETGGFGDGDEPGDDPGISDADLVGEEKGQEPDPDPEPEKPQRRARGAKAGKKKEPEKVEQKRTRRRRG